MQYFNANAHDQRDSEVAQYINQNVKQQCPHIHHYSYLPVDMTVLGKYCWMLAVFRVFYPNHQSEYQEVHNHYEPQDRRD
jgi:hypothetical protein